MEPTLFKTYFDLNIKEILSNDLYNFLNMNAISEGTNIGFLFALVLCIVTFFYLRVSLLSKLEKVTEGT